MSGFTVYSVEYTHCDSGERCRIPCGSREDATEVAAAIFDVHYGVRVVTEVMQ